VKAFGRSEINDAGFFPEMAGDRIRADLEQFSDLTNRKELLLLHCIPFRMTPKCVCATDDSDLPAMSSTLTAQHPLMLPQAAQTDESHLPSVPRQYRLASKRNFPYIPRPVPDGKLAEAAELHRESIRPKVVEKGAFKA
jgi:hypothetical protein